MRSVCRPAAPNPIRIRIRKAGASCTFQDMPRFLRRKRPSIVFPKAWRGGRPPFGGRPGINYKSELVDAAADGGVVDPLAVHLLRLDLLGDRIDELVVLPERRLLVRHLDALLDVQLAVDVLRLAHVLADELLVRTVREHLAVELIDDDVEVAIDEAALLIADLGVSL